MSTLLLSHQPCPYYWQRDTICLQVSGLYFFQSLAHVLGICTCYTPVHALLYVCFTSCSDADVEIFKCTASLAKGNSSLYYHAKYDSRFNSTILIIVVSLGYASCISLQRRLITHVFYTKKKHI